MIFITKIIFVLSFGLTVSFFSCSLSFAQEEQQSINQPEQVAVKTDTIEGIIIPGTSEDQFTSLTSAPFDPAQQN